MNSWNSQLLTWDVNAIKQSSKTLVDELQKSAKLQEELIARTADADEAQRAGIERLQRQIEREQAENRAQASAFQQQALARENAKLELNRQAVSARRLILKVSEGWRTMGTVHMPAEPGKLAQELLKLYYSLAKIPKEVVAACDDISGDVPEFLRESPSEMISRVGKEILTIHRQARETQFKRDAAQYAALVDALVAKAGKATELSADFCDLCRMYSDGKSLLNRTTHGEIINFEDVLISDVSAHSGPIVEALKKIEAAGTPELRAAADLANSMAGDLPAKIRGMCIDSIIAGLPPHPIIVLDSKPQPHPIVEVFSVRLMLTRDATVPIGFDGEELSQKITWEVKPQGRLAAIGMEALIVLGIISAFWFSRAFTVKQMWLIGFASLVIVNRGLVFYRRLRLKRRKAQAAEWAEGVKAVYMARNNEMLKRRAEWLQNGEAERKQLLADYVRAFPHLKSILQAAFDGHANPNARWGALSAEYRHPERFRVFEESLPKKLEATYPTLSYCCPEEPLPTFSCSVPFRPYFDKFVGKAPEIPAVHKVF